MKSINVRSVPCCTDTCSVYQLLSSLLQNLVFDRIAAVKGFGAVIRYLTEVRSELSKVVWPKRTEVVRLTLVVILMSAIVAVFVGLIDFGLTKALSNLLGI